MIFALVTAAAIFGTWWYLKSKDDAGDFEDFDDEEDDELDAFLKEESEEAGKDREYVPIDLAGEAAEGAGKIIGDAKKEAAEKASVVKDAVDESVSEFKFENLQTES